MNMTVLSYISNVDATTVFEEHTNNLGAGGGGGRRGELVLVMSIVIKLSKRSNSNGFSDKLISEIQ